MKPPKPKRTTFVLPRMPDKFVGTRVDQPAVVVDPGVPIKRYPVLEFHRVEPDEFDPAKARFINSIRRPAP